MKTLNRFIILGALAITCFAQQKTVIQTSLSAAAVAGASTIVVASATGINAPSTSVPGSMLYIVEWGQTKGEAVTVSAVSGTTISVRHGGPGKGAAHASGAMVLVATSPDWFVSTDPIGSCTTANTYATPLLNIQNGNQWLCSTITLTWVPGFGNYAAPPAATTAVASAAGLITPSGPLFHITGTAAITGFNVPLGYNGGRFCVIPDGAYTTTTANNIALASTATTSKIMCFDYDKAASKPFFPSY